MLNSIRNWLVPGTTLDAQLGADLEKQYVPKRTKGGVSEQSLPRAQVSVMQRANELPATGGNNDDAFDLRELNGLAPGVKTLFGDERVLSEALRHFEAPTEVITGPTFNPLAATSENARVRDIDPHTPFMIAADASDLSRFPESFRLSPEYKDVAARVQLWLNRDGLPEGILANPAAVPPAGAPFTIQLVDVKKALLPENLRWFTPPEVATLRTLESVMEGALRDSRGYDKAKVRLGSELGDQTVRLGTFAGIELKQTVRTRLVGSVSMGVQNDQPTRTERMQLERHTTGITAEGVPAGHKLLVVSPNFDRVLTPVDGTVVLPPLSQHGFIAVLLGPNGERVAARQVDVDNAQESVELSRFLTAEVYDVSGARLERKVTSISDGISPTTRLSYTSAELVWATPETEVAMTSRNIGNHSVEEVMSRVFPKRQNSVYTIEIKDGRASTLFGAARLEVTADWNCRVVASGVDVDLSNNGQNFYFNDGNGLMVEFDSRHSRVTMTKGISTGAATLANAPLLPEGTF